MKKLHILSAILILVLISWDIPFSFANTLTPPVKEIQLSQGERMISSVIFENKENRDIEILLSVYEYDPQTKNISQEQKNIFIKADTDTFLVKKGETKEIQYEIYPLSNLELGTYFNILVLSESKNTEEVYINQGISQLVVLHITNSQEAVKGITTDSYLAKIEIIDKGIPLLKPLKIKYTFTNNSTYTLTPTGRIDVFNKRDNYKPEYLYINTKGDKIYPKESKEEILTINNWHISDIFSERVVQGHFYNGLDDNPKIVEEFVNSYIYEVLAILVFIVLTILLGKSIKEDRKKKKSKKTV